MDTPSTVTHFNKILLDLLDNFSSVFPDSGLYKYKILLKMNNSDRWIKEFSTENIYSKKDLFNCSSLETLGFSDLKLDRDHKKVLWKYFTILSSLKTNFKLNEKNNIA
jgi:hypothetical protein